MKRFDDYTTPGLVYTARVEASKIGLLQMLVEGHEGLAIIRTKDPALGIVEFWISPPMRADFESLLQSLRAELGVVAGPPDEADMTTLVKQEWT